jgi:Bacterial Ig-like domain (group 3)
MKAANSLVSRALFGLGAVLSVLWPPALGAQSATSTTAARGPEITSKSTGNGAASIHIGLPPGVETDGIQIVLNGKNVAERFEGSTCGKSTCEDATLSAVDGLREEKNVLAVVAKGGVSGRLRFDNRTAGTPAPASIAATSLLSSPDKAQATVTNVPPPILEPTVTMRTAYTGGWNGAIDAAHPWLMVGNQYFPNVQPANCGPSGSPTGRYLVIVLDRQTLQEKTSAPESSPQCFGDEGSMKTYLTSLDSGDLVIAGTTFEHDADANLDFTPIGGTLHSGKPGDSGYPAGILAIGAGRATTGSAYEGYYVHDAGSEPVLPFAYGTAQEDAYGNYNFQSSEVVEYTVSPNDPGFLTPTKTTAINIAVPAQFPSGNPAVTSYTYTPPSGDNGYWLLTVSRYSLATYPYSCTNGSTSSDGHTIYIPNCGTFYPTGSSDTTTSQNAYAQLAHDLGNINSWQLAFLTTVGQAAYGGSNNSMWNVAGWTGYGTTTNAFTAFSKALEALNGSSRLTQSLISPTSAYTLITSNGIGGPLNGNAVESTTVLSAQGQTGLVHGILQRNLNGLFLPQQTNQETVPTFTLKGGIDSPEFKLTEAAQAPPVDWPSNSATTKLPGADSISGQISAYRYFSYVLLKNVYLPNITGDHLDDIHYFFPSSLNTSINYHFYDPKQILWPGLPNNFGPYVKPCYSVSGDGLTCTVYLFSNSDPVVFTQNDFVAMRTQISTEIHYLTDTLQYLVTGSTNMKDIISGGNSNVGLALTGAAATILGSKLVPVPPTTQVTTSWQSILSMISGVASLASAVPGLGEIAGIAELGTNAAKIFGGGSSAVGGILGIASGAGGISSSVTSSTLPSAFSKFATTVGDLANGSMQDQLSIGFDTMTDSIASDWGRLSTIGPMVMDTSNTTFFAPNQVEQSISVAALTQAASRSFYLALMPSFYKIHYWPGVFGDAKTPTKNMPDMGYQTNDESFYYCSAYYLNPQQNSADTFNGLGTITPYASAYYPSLMGTPEYFDKDHSPTPVDYYVIAGATTGAGSDDPQIQVIDESLAANLFSTSGLNLPIDEFVHKNGPMSGVWADASQTNPASHRNPTVCNANWFPNASADPDSGIIGSQGNSDPGIDTQTTLSAPASVVEGTGAVLTATITANKTPLTVSQVYFLDNGQIVSTIPVDKTGTATVTWSNLTLGDHKIQAKFVATGDYNTSSSAVATLGAYSAAPDLSLSLGATSVSLSGDASSSVNLQANSLYGLAGTLSFSCTGLPADVNCAFKPQSVPITGNGSATSVLTIARTQVQSAGISSLRSWLALVLMPASFLMLWMVRKHGVVIRGMVALLLLAAVTVGGVAGCGGSGSPKVAAPTGPQTILVNATTGTVTKTVPLTLNLQ